ncbi:MAG: cysteine desulfurase [Parcubacteria group bacterium]|nr:cysteine desulfurase [Parcubacteria group bacterium]
MQKKYPAKFPAKFPIMLERRIYLDHAATTPPDRRVLEAMQKTSREAFGNPSSIHKEGVLVQKILKAARECVASVLHALPDEIIFTSGGTESNNLAVFGAVSDVSKEMPKAHLIVSKIEHPSILECARELERRGAELTYLPVSLDGVVSPKSVKDALRKNTVLVSVMYANNEIGTIQPIMEIAKVIRQHNKNGGKTLFHTDACQAVNYLPMNVQSLGVDLMTCNASKIYGPKGVGCLYAKRGLTSLSPIIFGGGQEYGLRSGTENAAAIAGFAQALEVAEKMKEKESARLLKLRDFFIHEVLTKIPDTVLNGSAIDRLPNNVNISFLGTDAEEVVVMLDARGIAASTGSACANTGKEGKVSDVILALDGDRIRAMGAVRFTLGRDTKKEDILRAVKELQTILKKTSA